MLQLNNLIVFLFLIGSILTVEASDDMAQAQILSRQRRYLVFPIGSTLQLGG